MKKNNWLDGMMGLVVGDALGVPVQFMSREEIRGREEGLVKSMESGGVYEMPEGTWSDDSSMALATMVSILEMGEADPIDIMERFVSWEYKGEYTPFGEAFDEGNTCSWAIYNYTVGKNIYECGKRGEHANGNGALMRILPACLYFCERQYMVLASDDEAINGIHIISALTHNHIRSQMCCGIYYFMVKRIIDGVKSYLSNKEEWSNLPEGFYGIEPEKPALLDLLQLGMDDGIKYYDGKAETVEINHLNRMLHLGEFKNEAEENIRTTGYVVDSFEAAIWCLLNSASYKDCMLKAVNLGDDTDTVAAIAGGLAGLYYGYEAIPAEWLSVIKKREWIEELCSKADRWICGINKPLADMHMHCIPGVDDGAATAEMAMEMIRESYLQGVRNIFCTSHDSAYYYGRQNTLDRFEEIKSRCAAVMPDLNLYLGCEIACYIDEIDEIIEKLNDGTYPSMNGSKYVLLEFDPYYSYVEQIKTCVSRVTGAGYKVIIAHAERYCKVIDGLTTIRELKEMGALIQVNAYSFVEESKDTIKALANAMLDEQLIDFIGTDAHRTNHRPPRIIKGIKEIYRRADEDYSDKICFKNALTILE